MPEARRGDITVAYDGKFYSWWADGGMARHSYKVDDPAQQQRFRYTLSQMVAGQQKAQELIDQVGGPMARDPEEVEREKDLLRQAGIRVD